MGLSSPFRGAPSVKTDLTEISDEPAEARQVEVLLDLVGLELWRSPDGFWAIRLKASAQAQPAESKRRRRR